MITVKTQFLSFAKDFFLRCDEKYHLIESICGYNIFDIPKNNQIPLFNILKEDYILFNYEEDKEYKGIPTGKSYIDEEGDLIGYQSVSVDDHPNRIKYALDSNHILISSLRLARAPALYFENLDFKNYVFSNGFYSFKVSAKWNKKYVMYLLRTKKIKSIIDNNIYRGIGISSYSSIDLLKIPVRNIPISEQNLVLEKINVIEKKIRFLKNSKISIQETIDSVFQREFGFDYDKFDELKSNRHYTSQQSLFSNNPDLRFSAKFHRPAGDFVMEQLKKISDKKIKHFISEPIILGASISPKDFDKNGSSYYISMASIKNLEIELDDSQLISDSYFSKNKNKTLQINDIVIARSGVAIGKIAIVKNDFDGIFADFTMRIRINEQKCSPLFAYYYFRSSFFQYLIEIYKKGLQNQNIFPTMIQEFPIPDISLSEQKRIVDEIQTEIKKQDDIKLEIASLRNKIDDIIIQTVSA